MNDLDRECFSALATAIICQAIKDWMLLTANNVDSIGKINYKEIRFFLSQGLGEDLCDFLHLDSQHLISILEKRLHEYKTKGTMPINIPYLNF